MKKVLLLLGLVATCIFANAQSTDYHAFKFDIGFGYAIPSDGSGTQAGATFTLQPHYRFTDDFALGLRIEAAAIGYENSATNNFKVSALASTCLSGEFYLSDRGFRPFIGAGLGLFDEESVAKIMAVDNNNVDGDELNVSNRTINFGAYPVIGFEAGHFRLSVEYDVTGNSNNYAAFKIGAFFGGGRKPKKQ
jgi:hypothetical protein